MCLWRQDETPPTPGVYSNRDRRERAGSDSSVASASPFGQLTVLNIEDLPMAPPTPRWCIGRGPNRPPATNVAAS